MSDELEYMVVERVYPDGIPREELLKYVGNGWHIARAWGHGPSGGIVVEWERIGACHQCQYCDPQQDV